MRSTLTAAIITVLARIHNIKVVERPIDDACEMLDCYAREKMERPAPHWSTRAQQKKLVLPKRSRRSKRR